MQKQQVFKVKGMQRDASMANANGEFAYEILNVRLMPAEDLSGFSLTNEKGTTQVITGISGQVIGQCPTNDSLVVFTTNATYNENDERTGGFDYIYEIYQTPEGNWTGGSMPLYQGDLNFHVDKHIEALFNYETEDIQKVYWIDGINQLRCINLVGEIQTDNDQQFDSVKEINSLPSVEIERVVGGSFTAGVIQYYITYFNKNSSESPIVYTSPLLYIAHDNRGANVNDQVSTAFKLTFTDLDNANWEYMRIYATHRTSVDATPEVSIVTELNMDNSTIEFTDYGSNRTSIAPTDLYFTGGKFVKAGTMTVKDQVMFLGNLNIETEESIQYDRIKDLFDTLRDNGEIDNLFSTETRKSVPNKIEEYQHTYYTYRNQLNNTKPITHYKYGEKYRFGISVMDRYGNWSNPIWIKDAFIRIPPEQVSESTLELPCPSLDISKSLSAGYTLWEKLQEFGAKSIKPLIVFPTENERKVIAQGVVCPTVYNLKDRKENGPYTQASWFMRPNAPVDLWGISSDNFGKDNIPLLYDISGINPVYTLTRNLSHKSDVINFPSNEGNISDNRYAGYYGAASEYLMNNGLTPFDYVYDDFSVSTDSDITDPATWEAQAELLWYDSRNRRYGLGSTLSGLSPEDQKKVYEKGSWVEFRHNYALRTKGWSFGHATPKQTWAATISEFGDNFGMVRAAELDTSMFNITPPTNRFFQADPIDKVTLEYGDNLSLDNVYFLTTDSHKSIRKRVKKGETCHIYICYLYLYQDTANSPTKKILHVVDKIRIRKAHWNGYFNVEVIVTDLKLGEFSGKFKESIRTKTTADLEEFEGLTNYYVWDVGSVHEDDSEKNYTNIIIGQKYPSITIPLVNRGEDTLKYGELPITDLNVGKSAYYIDNSIITLNSPEIEFKPSDLQNYSDSNFRIIGMVPLTATSSDVSLEVTNPSTDSHNLGTGLIKRTYSNTNIGYHGFKGIVGSNAYLTTFESDQVNGAYSLIPLHPWQTTGTLGYHRNTSSAFGDKDILSKKILSNQRFAATTYYFGINTLSFKGSLLSNDDNAYLDETNIIGWKPSNGCFIDTFTNDTKEGIVKLFDLGYSTSGLVYRGNIDDIATMTKGITNTPVSNPIYSFGHYAEAEASTNIVDRMNSPASGTLNNERFKTGGASIKYKSSPHFVIGFRCFDSLWGSAQKIQEVLPAWATLNEEGIASFSKTQDSNISLNHGSLFEDPELSSLYHQNYISTETGTFGLPSRYTPSRYDDYAFTNQYSNVISIGKGAFVPSQHLEISSGTFNWYAQPGSPSSMLSIKVSVSPNTWEIELKNQKLQSVPDGGYGQTTYIVGGETNTNVTRYSEVSFKINFSEAAVAKIMQIWQAMETDEIVFNAEDGITISYYSSWEGKMMTETLAEGTLLLNSGSQTSRQCTIELQVGDNISIILDNLTLLREVETSTIAVPNYGWLWLGEIYRENDPTFGGTEDYNLQQNSWESAGDTGFSDVIIIEEQLNDENEVEEIETIAQKVFWTIGDTYYQRFDTLKTYAYDDKAQNSVIDITSFMVETRINIDGRTDRNRGQESNLQMSPTNFNLLNNIYSQRDNFFTYRILDEDLQARTNFPNQITWSLAKTAGATVDAWMNITLASVLDLDGTKGELTALKNFNNNIIAFQEKGLSHIMFNSRAQIATSEAVPIQIANTGKVDGQQYFTTDVGCQDKWNIVTTPNGLYFVDYFNKSIYKFNGQLEDISTPNGFRSWCYENLSPTANILGYYDVKNKEVMYYIGDTRFMLDNNIYPDWLGFSELTNAFSSFYTYPKAWFANVQYQGLWLLSGDNNTTNVYTHQTGNYNELLNIEKSFYGLTVIPRQDSNLVKTFNNVEFRADSYNGSTLDNDHTFDTISAETEYQDRTTDTLTYSQYRPSNLKKKSRTWKANIPRVNNGYKRFVNQWAKIGLWKMNPSTEKTILHDLSVWYSE